jgi:hypothetical protein
MKGKKLKEISENKPDTGFVKVQILFFAQRPVCVYVCKSEFFQYFDQNEWTQSGLFTQKSHTCYSDPAGENTIQGYFYILFCHRDPNTFSGYIVSFVGLHHRVYRVPGFLSNRLNLVPPTPSPSRECCSSHLWVLGEDTLARGDPIQTKGRDTLVLYVYYGLRSAYTVLYISAALKKIHRDQNRPIPS